MNFQKTIFIAIVSSIVTIVLATVIIPILKKIKIGQIERDDGPQSHLKKQGTPTMGGIIFILGIIICTVFCYINFKKIGQNELANKIVPMVCLIVGFGIVGFIDDFKKLVLHNTKGLKPSYKMMGLLVISVIYIVCIIKNTHNVTEIIIPIWKKEILLPLYIYVPFAILVILATTNAINLTDGVDRISFKCKCINYILLNCCFND